MCATETTRISRINLFQARCWGSLAIITPADNWEIECWLLAVYQCFCISVNIGKLKKSWQQYFINNILSSVWAVHCDFHINHWNWVIVSCTCRNKYLEVRKATVPLPCKQRSTGFLFTVYTCMRIVGTGRQALLLKLTDAHPSLSTRALRFYYDIYGISSIAILIECFHTHRPTCRLLLSLAASGRKVKLFWGVD